MIGGTLSVEQEIGDICHIEDCYQSQYDLVLERGAVQPDCPVEER